VESSYTIHKTVPLGQNSSSQPIRLPVISLRGTVHWQNGTIAQCYTMREACLSPSACRGNFRSHARNGNPLSGLRLPFNTERLQQERSREI